MDNKELTNKSMKTVRERKVWQWLSWHVKDVHVNRLQHTAVYLCFNILQNIKSQKYEHCI